MHLAQHASPEPTSPAPLATAAEAERLAAHLVDVMDTLVGVVQQEIDLVRAGRLTAAARLEAAKSDLTRLYVADTLRLRASHKHLAAARPMTLAALRQRHDAFRSLLQINMAVLATAHAVSEGIVRGVSDELARKSAPQTYGASGRRVAPGPSAGQPLALSRML